MVESEVVFGCGVVCLQWRKVVKALDGPTPSGFTPDRSASSALPSHSPALASLVDDIRPRHSARRAPLHDLVFVASPRAHAT